MQASKLAWCLLVATAVAAPSGRALAGSPRDHHHKGSALVDEDSDRADHYRDRGAKPARAEQLGVSVRARALLDKSGKTDFELSTGPLDSGAAAAAARGNIDEVKVSARAWKKKVFEKEFEHLRAGGYFHHAWDGLLHGLYLDVKTHVSGFGKGKEDLPFKLGTQVLYRPDLAVQSLQYATVVRPNTVDITFSYSDALYVSTGYCNSVAATSLGCTPGDYVTSMPLGTAGQKLSIGSSYSANVVVDDGTAYTAQPNMTLNTTHTVQPLSDPFCFSTDFPMTCLQFADDNTARH